MVRSTRLKGTLQFSDVTVDEHRLYQYAQGSFPNPQHSLLPGMFVRARIDEGVQPNAILSPAGRVTRMPRGDAMAMVVNDVPCRSPQCRGGVSYWR